jgi:hypothetical protein
MPSDEDLDHFKDSVVNICLTDDDYTNLRTVGQYTTGNPQKRHGWNVIAYKSGEIKEGFYRDGHEHGPFRHITSTGVYYYCSYEDGSKVEKEHYITDGGDTIETTYGEEEMEVNEVYYFKTGTVKESKYENGTWIETKQSYWKLAENGRREIS